MDNFKRRIEGTFKDTKKSAEIIKDNADDRIDEIKGRAKEEIRDVKESVIDNIQDVKDQKRAEKIRDKAEEKADKLIKKALFVNSVEIQVFKRDSKESLLFHKMKKPSH